MIYKLLSYVMIVIIIFILLVTIFGVSWERYMKDYSACTTYTLQFAYGNNLVTHHVNDFKIDNEWVLVEDKLYPVDKLYNIQRNECDE